MLKINYSREYTEKNVRGDFMGNETLVKKNVRIKFTVKGFAFSAFM